jgi:hypothetical protein
VNVTLVRQIQRFITSPELRAACLPPADFEIDELRRGFADFVHGSRKQFSCWQEAWNDWTDARPGQPGLFRVTQRCHRCRGRGIDMRRGMVCTDCMGRRRTKVTVRTKYLPVESEKTSATTTDAL